MEENKKSYYAIIPANVRYSNITPNAKLLYGEITALCNEKGYCWATNEYFANLYGVSKTSVSLWIKELIDHGFVGSTLKYKENSKEIERRILTIEPIKENLNTYLRNLKGGIKENLKENNTFNNTYEYIDDVVRRNRKIITYCEQYLGGSLTKQALDDLIGYIDFGMDSELIIRAVDKARDTNNRRWAYVNGILKNWKKDNIRTTEQAIEQDNQFHNKNDKPMSEEERREKRRQEMRKEIDEVLKRERNEQ